MKPTLLQAHVLNMLNTGASMSRRRGEPNFTLTPIGAKPVTVNKRTVESMRLKGLVDIVYNTNDCVVKPLQKTKAKSLPKQFTTAATIASVLPSLPLVRRSVEIAKEREELYYKRNARVPVLVGIVLRSFVESGIAINNSEACFQRLALRLCYELSTTLGPYYYFNELDIQLSLHGTSEIVAQSAILPKPLNLQTCILLACHEAPPPLSYIYGKKRFEGRSHIYEQTDDLQFVVTKK